MAFRLTQTSLEQALANPVNFADSLTKAQENQLRLQALRDEYNAAKEERDRQRQCVKAWLASCKTATRHQRNIALHFHKPCPQVKCLKGITGVLMPQGMTGVLASERGQNLPQPALFGENILQGNFDINRGSWLVLLLKVETAYFKRYFDGQH